MYHAVLIAANRKLNHVNLTLLEDLMLKYALFPCEHYSICLFTDFLKSWGISSVSCSCPVLRCSHTGPAIFPPALSWLTFQTSAPFFLCFSAQFFLLSCRYTEFSFWIKTVTIRLHSFCLLWTQTLQRAFPHMPGIWAVLIYLSQWPHWHSTYLTRVGFSSQYKDKLP